MFERFTKSARRVVVGAQGEAIRLKHPTIGTEHLLLALLTEESGGAYLVLHEAGLDRDGVRTEVQRLVGTPGRVLTQGDADALKTIGIDLDAVLASVERSFGAGTFVPAERKPERRGLLRRRHPEIARGSRFGPRAKKVLELSLREALRLDSKEIGSEHILLGILREGDGLAAKIIADAGISIDDLRQAAIDQLGKAA
jgi:ATP-dependent Clp protease ATP-binding subunit ClpA